jgi:hypothetical protein
MMEKMIQLGGKYSHAKRIAQEVMEWSPRVQKIVLENYIEGDGTYSAREQSLRFTTASRQMAFQLAQLSWRNEIPLNLSICKANGKSCKKDSYLGHISQDYVATLDVSKSKNATCSPSFTVRNISRLKHQSVDRVAVYKKIKPLSYIKGDFVYRRVNKINQSYSACKVYDLTVDDDHSFVVNWIAAHNSRQQYDICSKCKHKATSDKDRCDCIKNHLGEITKEGIQIHMINENPHWFEISFVKRGADRIGMSIKVLNKTAQIK